MTSSEDGCAVPSATANSEEHTKVVQDILSVRTGSAKEYYVKYKDISYLHCEWRTEEELVHGDKRFTQKMKRFHQKQEQAANVFEFPEEENEMWTNLFNPDYVEVDRVLDKKEHTEETTGKVTCKFLVKWKALSYEEGTWELEEDVDPKKIKLYEKNQSVSSRLQDSEEAKGVGMEEAERIAGVSHVLVLAIVVLMLLTIFSWRDQIPNNAFGLLDFSSPKNLSRQKISWKCLNTRKLLVSEFMLLEKVKACEMPNYFRSPKVPSVLLA